MTELSIEPSAKTHLGGLDGLVGGRRLERVRGRPRAGRSPELDIRTRTEGYYERFGASRSLAFA